IAKLDEQEDTESGEGNAEETESDEESAEEETRKEEEESFNPIPRTPKDSGDDGNGEEDQGLRVSDEQRLIEEEEADELYRDVDINQGRGLQVSQDIKDSHVTLTLVKPDGQQESSSVSSFVTSMLNPISDAGNKSIQRSNEQRNLYKALVDAYEADKTILESYGDTSILKRRRGDDDDQEGPSTGSDWGRRDEEKQADSRSSFNELLDTSIDFSNFIMNRLCVDTLTPELLAGPTYELIRESCTSLTELEYHLEEVYKATTDQLDWVNPEGQQYPHNLLQPLLLILDNQGRRRRIIAVTDLKIVEWHNYKHLDWISVRRDDDKIYKFKEGNFKRLRLQDIEDMLLLLVQG
nr:hypothetical protein [Tanacetum cinerariifolium]